MSRPSHCEWRPFPGCDSCAYKGGDALRSDRRGVWVVALEGDPAVTVWAYPEQLSTVAP